MLNMLRDNTGSSWMLQKQHSGLLLLDGWTTHRSDSLFAVRLESDINWHVVIQCRRWTTPTGILELDSLIVVLPRTSSACTSGVHILTHGMMKHAVQPYVLSVN